MKRLVCGIVLGVWAFAMPLQAESSSHGRVRASGAQLGEWTQDVEAARALAKEQGKYLFMNFTGSDWCGWCKLMDEHVFSKQGWKDFASKHLALAFIDMPRDKTLVPEEYKARNRQLMKEYGVSGFPTFVVCGPDGHVAGRLGASRSGNDLNFVTNVVAVFVEDSLPELVSPQELAEYREAQQEKAEWEKENSAQQAAFKRDYATPWQQAGAVLDKQRAGILEKAAVKFREQVKPNPFATDAAVVFADAGKGVLTNGAAFGRWTSDFEAASALAGKSGKDLLIAFVGPGWCRWGDEMERDVFNTDEWMSYAKEHLVLVYVDCPNENGAETHLPGWLLERNVALYKRYAVAGCPTYVLADADGTRYDAFGAMPKANPKDQIAALEMMMARRRLHSLVSTEDSEAYAEATRKQHELNEQWRKDYDKFISETDEFIKRFEPIAEKRNRIFLKAMKAYQEANPL